MSVLQSCVNLINRLSGRSPPQLLPEVTTVQGDHNQCLTMHLANAVCACQQPCPLQTLVMTPASSKTTHASSEIQQEHVTDLAAMKMT